MILSNWHVLAGASAASVGEGILQPGRIDGGTQVVATLTRMVLDARMDAAVATLNGTRGHATEILGLGSVTGIDAPTLGMNVVKSGRTTGITRGVVDGVSLSTSINYGDPGIVAFSNQIRIVPRAPWPAVDYEVSMGGDSGSVWLNEANRRAVGLHFAGETDPTPASENAICSPIGPIATELNFSFLPVLCPVRPPVWNICERYPWICELIRRPWPPVIDPRPWRDPPFDPFGGLGGFGGFGGLLRNQSADGECRCGAGDHAQPSQAQLLAVLAALLSGEH
jgi:endonuclease G